MTMMAGPSVELALAALSLVSLGYYTLFLFTGVPGDAVLLLIFSVFRRQRHILADCVDSALFGGLVKAAKTTCIAFIVFQIFRLVWTRVSDPPWNRPGKVLLFPCNTTHARLFPKKHSFTYSYLVVGVPVGWEGNAGGMVSVGPQSSKSGLSSWFSLRPQVRKGWYHIDPADYLARGKGHLGLRGKLDEYLESQGADPAEYPHAYLVTAARFLGYQFNPVSFWYLYDANKSLTAMILEVNNTFDERRMYFLTPDDGNQIEAMDGVNELKTIGRTVLKQSWPKDFHVSPFNSRKGSYSLIASDPLSPSMQGTGPVTNTINLNSSKGHGKLVARLIPDGAAVDPYTMTVFEKLKFLVSWWWVGFVTFPRIVREAGILFFRRKLHVWYRPEPLKQSIGRNADATERQLEPFFRRYLRYLVEQSTAPIAVKYIPSGISQEGAQEVMLSPSAAKAKDSGGFESAVEELEFKVLTPVFYSRFVHYAHDLEALFCELNESCTIWVSRPDLLPKLVIKQPSPTLESSNYGEFVYFKLIQNLRVRPERIERPLTSSAVPTEKLATTVDIRGFRISSMDGYVLAHETPKARKIYGICVLKLFLADQIAFGSVPLLEAQRLIIAWLLSGAITWVFSDNI
ncbi:hypothetical protein QBC46DRAFT_61854 [Diplogelasinospora grovesii]|uniref:Uncharacterized protein n=1 Tax=Diplogelasinospora grovesii TaxID=303347 RepID=A0AAN6NHE4_9PEZI|nr:hypothetical protein QBC46DRAFT_61854 [Diplogelasinospora grovesii]